MRIPNQQPLVQPSGSARIAIVGAAPCRDEENLGALLTGISGKMLHGVLGQVGIPLNQCFVGNLSQRRPMNDFFDKFTWHDLQEDITTLRRDLEAFQPSIVLCLGNAPLHLFRHGNFDPGRHGHLFNWHSKIQLYRGTLFESSWIPGLKCVATYDFTQVSREFDLQAYSKFDITRLRDESFDPTLQLPERAIGIAGVHMPPEKAIEILKMMEQGTETISIDIEGYPGNITCIAFSRRPGNALVIPFAGIDGLSTWDEWTERALWAAVKSLIECPTAPKLAQNGFYDFFALAWTLGITVQNWAHDTILGWWELYPELKMGLATQASILTKEPYYKPDKDEGSLKFPSNEDFWRYNGIDAAVTLECHQKQLAIMTPAQRGHYQFNMEIAIPVLYIMLRGIRWDKKQARIQRKQALKEVFVLQAQIDAASNRTELLAALRDEPTLATLILRQLGGSNPMVKKVVTEIQYQPMRWNGKKWVKNGRLSDVTPPDAARSTEPPVAEQEWFRPKPRQVLRRTQFAPKTLNELNAHILGSNAKEWKRVRTLLKGIDPTDLAALGELSILLGLAVNASSTNAGGDAQDFVYTTCGLRRIFKDERTGRYSMESEADHRRRLKGQKVSNPAGKKPCTDQQSLDQLYARSQDVRVLWVLQQRRLKKVATDLQIEVDIDSRVRASVSLIKETGRMSEKKSPLNTGLNRQALNKDLRNVCIADPGCVFIQRDLSGADSWTVAAECAVDDDRTMLDDLLAGLKPAKILALLYVCGPSINLLDRDALKAKLAEEEPSFPPWLYAGAKACVHGSSYLMGHNTMIDTLLKGSMADLPLKLEDAKPLVLTKLQVETLQNLFFSRYPGLAKWHQREGWNLMIKGSVTMSTGHTRTVFGRKAEIKKGHLVPCHETLKAILSTKPQYYTTLGVKLALWNLWNDPQNRDATGALRIEPLVLVHDSILVQTRERDKDLARVKMREWFDNELDIANEKITIPADGSIATDWSMKNAETL
jgi:uracil-DNA glycosylase family 4